MHEEGIVTKTARKRITAKFLICAVFLMLSVTVIGHNADTVHAEATVYVTKTGSKYHAYKCGNGTYYATTLSDALTRGLSPCSKCFGSSTPGNGNPGNNGTVSMKINKASVVLIKGQTTTLKISGTTGNVSWKSSKTSVATVTQNGKVKAKKKGKTVITATSGSSKKTCAVTVESSKLTAAQITLYTGKTKTLKLSGCKHSVKWSTNKPSVVKVKNGKITAKKVGTAKITAKVHGKSFVCKVTVKKPTVRSS